MPGGSFWFRSAIFRKPPVIIPLPGVGLQLFPYFSDTLSFNPCTARSPSLRCPQITLLYRLPVG